MTDDLEYLDSLKTKYISLSRYLKTPISMKKIKFFNWVCLSFSAFGTAFFIHWGITAPLSLTNIDFMNTIWVVFMFGFIIVWPVFIVALLIGFAFSIALYTSTYDSIAEKVHNSVEKQRKGWLQSLLFFETSWDVLFIRATGVAGMIMLSYGAVQNFNDALIKEAEFVTAQKAELNKYRNIEPIVDKIEYWTEKTVNNKRDDDAVTDSMLTYYQNQLALYNHRADSLNNIVYDRAEIKTMQAVDVTASVKFLSKGNEFLAGLMLIILLAIIALANDGSAVKLTRIESRFDQAEQIKDIYERQLNIVNQSVNEASSRQVDGNSQAGGSGGFGFDFDSNRIKSMMNQINSLWISGKSSLQDIANNFNVTKQYIHALKEAMKETGRLIG